jgi:hypothetical protein
MKQYILLFFAVCTLSACSSLKVVPQQQANGTVNLNDNSQTITRESVLITVKSGDAEILSYNLDGSVASFFVIIDNQTDGELQYDNDSFLLVDSDGRQYFPLTPDKVKEMVARNTYYLIPYPYVGFYYLEDYEKSTFNNRLTSDRPYFYELYPQDIYTKALPVGSIIPKAKVAGLVYFRIDFQDKKAVNLMVYKKGSSKSAAADFNFPFKIVK